MSALDVQVGGEKMKDVAIERDPNGLDAHSVGAKLDQGKPRCSLVLGGFARALIEVSEVGTFGANKYTDNGWLQVNNGRERYSDAALRHRLKSSIEDCDPDSGLLHKAHEAWNVLAELELMLIEKDKIAGLTGEA